MKTWKRPDWFRSGLLYLYLSLPLLYVIDSPFNTRSVRWVALLCITTATLTVSRIRKQGVQNYQRLPKSVRLSILGITILAGLSTLLSDISWVQRIAGLLPEFLGLLSWCSFVWLGLVFANDIRRHLLSLPVLILTMAVLVISFAISGHAIAHELRLSGLLLQPTHMGMWSVYAYVIGLFAMQQRNLRSRQVGFAIAITSIAMLLLTQSRVGFLAAVCTGIIYACLYYRRHQFASVLAIVATITIVLLPHIVPTFFDRFQLASVHRGTTYRLELYKASGVDVLQHNTLVGNGASSLPPAINNQDLVPEDIQHSLRTGGVFLSTHDMLFDFAYYFGVAAAVLLLGVFAESAITALRQRTNMALPLLIFGVLLLNALVNIPSLELTSLLFLVVFMLFLDETQEGKKSHAE